MLFLHFNYPITNCITFIWKSPDIKLTSENIFLISPNYLFLDCLKKFKFFNDILVKFFKIVSAGCRFIHHYSGANSFFLVDEFFLFS